MVARRWYARHLVVTLLAVALAKIAVLPLSSCEWSISRYLQQYIPIEKDVNSTGSNTYPSDSEVEDRITQNCLNDFSAEWNKLRVLGTYANISAFSPASIWRRSDGIMPEIHTSHNAYYGSANNPDTKLMYLVEGHSLYSPMYENTLAKEPKKIDGITLDEIKDGIMGQTATLEYISNTKTIYFKSYGPIADIIKGKISYTFGPSTYYHRTTCKGKEGRISVDELYEQIFPYVDQVLHRDICMDKNFPVAGFVDKYKPERYKFIEGVLADACDEDEKTSEVKPLSGTSEERPTFDCAKAADFIFETFAPPYLETPDSLRGDQHHDSHAYACPDLGMVAENKKNASEYIIQLMEYHPDELHPLISFSVAVYELNIKKKELSVKVRRARPRSVLPTSSFYPFQRMSKDKEVVKELDPYDHKAIITGLFDEIARLGWDETPPREPDEKIIALRRLKDVIVKLPIKKYDKNINSKLPKGEPQDREEPLVKRDVRLYLTPRGDFIDGWAKWYSHIMHNTGTESQGQNTPTDKQHSEGN